MINQVETKFEEQNKLIYKIDNERRKKLKSVQKIKIHLI